MKIAQTVYGIKHPYIIDLNPPPPFFFISDIMTNIVTNKETLMSGHLNLVISKSHEQNILTIKFIILWLFVDERRYAPDSIWHQTPIYHRYEPQLFTIGSGDIIFNDLLLLLSCVSIYIYDTLLHYDNSTLKQIFKKKQLNVTLEFVNRVYLLPSLDGTFHRTLINLLTVHAPQFC